jgi:VWFA-related protein
VVEPNPTRAAGLLLLCLLGLIWVSAASAQRIPANSGFEQSTTVTPEDAAVSGITITKRVDEVNLVFTVTDKHGRFVEKLPQSDFQLLDDHADPGPLEYFHQQSNLPMRVALLIDLSDSVRGRFKFEKQAAGIFLQHILRPDVDKAMVVGFDGSVHITHDLSSDVADLKRSIANLKAGGDTAFYDAVTLASEELRSARETTLTRRAIILISDGVDTASQNKLRAAEDAALQSGLVIFALSTNNISEPNAPGNKVMKHLTELTGGYILPAHESDELKAAFRRIEKAVRSQYALGYHAADLESRNFHSVEIIPRRHGLRVQCRKGYYAPHVSAER